MATDNDIIKQNAVLNLGVAVDATPRTDDAALGAAATEDRALTNNRIMGLAATC